MPNHLSFVDHLISQIMRNLEIKFTGLHVRFEDSYSIPGKFVAAGVTIEAFSMLVCFGVIHIDFMAAQRSNSLYGGICHRILVGQAEAILEPAK